MSRRAWIIFLIIGCAAPFLLYPVFVMKVLCAGLFASAFGLLIGYTGLLSFGHAAFFGTAAYVTGYLAKDLGVSPPLALLTGTLAALTLGALVGSLAIRRQGIYFAMITLALAQLVYFIVLQTPATGGEDGLQGVPRGALFGIDLSDSISMYFFVFVIFCLALAFIDRVIHSPFGQALKSVRENEPRAISLGFDADRLKLLAFILSAGLAGLAGGLNTLVFQLASLTDVNWRLSGEVVLMTLLGGMGTFLGPLIGAAVVVTLENRLGSSAGSWVQVIVGVTFIVCVLAFRRGIVGELLRALNAYFDRAAASKKEIS
jgi:branched-chain amino acid transport system permease protein